MRLGVGSTELGLAVGFLATRTAASPLLLLLLQSAAAPLDGCGEASAFVRGLQRIEGAWLAGEPAPTATTNSASGSGDKALEMETDDLIRQLLHLSSGAGAEATRADEGSWPGRPYACAAVR